MSSVVHLYKQLDEFVISLLLFVVQGTITSQRYNNALSQQRSDFNRGYFFGHTVQHVKERQQRYNLCILFKCFAVFKGMRKKFLKWLR